MVTATASRTKLVIESAEAVLGLHWFVARDYTAKEEGLEFEIITPLAGLATAAAAPTFVSTLTLIRPDCAYRWLGIVVLLAVTEVLMLTALTPAGSTQPVRLKVAV